MFVLAGSSIVETAERNPSAPKTVLQGVVSIIMQAMKVPGSKFVQRDSQWKHGDQRTDRDGHEQRAPLEAVVVQVFSVGRQRFLFVCKGNSSVV